MGERIEVEIVLGTPERQVLQAVTVDNGATIADVVAASGIAARFPDLDIDSLATGVWGNVLPRDYAVKDGDRIELYRPLEMDPREARRKLATAGRTMGQTIGAGGTKDPD